MMKVGDRVETWHQASGRRLPGVLVSVNKKSKNPYLVHLDCGDTVTYHHARPEETWTPEESETVAFWDINSTETTVFIDRLKSITDEYVTDWDGIGWDCCAKIPKNWKDEGYPLDLKWWQTNAEVFVP